MGCEVGRPVRPPPAQFQHGLAIGRQLQPILPDRRTQGIPAQPLQAVASVRRDHNARVEIEPMLTGVPAAEWRRIGTVNGIAPSTHRHARALAESRNAPHGRGRETRQGRRLFGVPIGRVEPLATIRHATAGQ